MPNLMNVQLKGKEKLLRELRDKPGRILSIVAGRMSRITMMLAGYVQSRKLSGQSLKVQTGILRSSVRALPTSVEGAKVTGTVRAAEGPSNAYGPVHEYGGRAHEITAVRAKMLSFVAGGKQRWAKSVMHPRTPAQYFMRNSLNENQEQIRAELEAAVDEALKNSD